MSDDLARIHALRTRWVDLFGWERPIPSDTAIAGFFTGCCKNDLDEQRAFTRQYYRETMPAPIGPIVQRVLANIRTAHGRPA